MKRIVLFGLLIAMLMTVCGCGSKNAGKEVLLIPESPAEDFEYEIENGQVRISKYIGTDLKIRVPAMIKDRPVTEIGGGAFSEYDMTYIYIPENVESIAGGAFAGCRLLENISLPESLKYIGKSAFSGCEALTAIELPDKVTVIELCTFSGCSSLKFVKLPNSLDTIEVAAFENCKSLATIDLPDGLKLIESGAFERCVSLKELRIPSSAWFDIDFRIGEPYDGENTYFCDTPLCSAGWRLGLPTFTTVLIVEENTPAHRQLIGSEEYGLKYEVR